MVFSAEDKILIKELKETIKGLWRNETHYRISYENWSLAGVSKLLKKIATTVQESGTLNISGSG